MHFIGHVAVRPRIPQPLEPLIELSRNLWWSWNADASNLFADLSPDLWQATHHNPVKLLARIGQADLEQAAADLTYVARLKAVYERFKGYVGPHHAWFQATFPQHAATPIAYFSAEFGIHEALPIYSGGLGILAGDHCKSASDLGIPLVGVGLLYNQGYFRQQLDATGTQIANHEKLDFGQLPIEEALDDSGNAVIIQVALPGRTIHAKVWRVQVGRVPLYLLDTDLDINAEADRTISAQLYGGDREMRIAQEIVLGIGGVRALRALGILPGVYHMNEGHSAFLGLELIREKVQQGLTFDEAAEAVAAGCCFTTHTPVPAGNDAFSMELIDKYFASYWESLGLNRTQFHDLAREKVGGADLFSMTVLALRMSRHRNGVSRLHGEVSRLAWHELWPTVGLAEVPIRHITNGVHTWTWLAPEMAALLDLHIGDGWRQHISLADSWKDLDRIPDEALWGTRSALKTRLAERVRERAERRVRRLGLGVRELEEARALLNPQALTIGFARRFATYKRATLLFHDLDRLKRILNDAQRPVQIVFAGKAHPADEPGKQFIADIHRLSQMEGLSGKILLLEDYDMDLSRHLVQGVDVWLNNPRRPLEASGTSGQKAALNGVLNLSILDGWWCEGYDGTNGWAIGEPREYQNPETQDEADALSLYALLEDEVIPLYYDDRQGWLGRVRRAIATCAPLFSTHRMLEDYTQQMYVPAAVAAHGLMADNHARARALNHWQYQVKAQWPNVYIYAEGQLPHEVKVGEPLQFGARLRSPGLDPDLLQVQLIVRHGETGADDILPMTRQERDDDGTFRYTTTYQPTGAGGLDYGIRLVPYHPDQLDVHQLGLVHWAQTGYAPVAVRV